MLAFLDPLIAERGEEQQDAEADPCDEVQYQAGFGLGVVQSCRRAGAFRLAHDAQDHAYDGDQAGHLEEEGV